MIFDGVYSWGLAEGRDEDLTTVDVTFLDQVAALVNGDVPNFAQVQQLYASDNRLRVPATFRSYTQGNVQTINLTTE